MQPPLLRLFVENGVLFGVYFIVLGFVMGQKNIYLPMLRDLGPWPIVKRRRQSATIPSPVHD